MNLSDFSVGEHFSCGGKSYQCTDVGTRTIVAISTEDADWMRGPPYAIAEMVFDEDDMPACTSVIQKKGLLVGESSND
jgi:hypothetical protein